MVKKHSRAAFAAIAFLILASPIASALCPTESREINMAAVVDEDSGGVFVLRVDVRPGSGQIYTSIDPRTGFSTQESEQEAADYAFSQSGVPRSECDVLFSMRGDFGSNRIDGPSAGGSMSAAVKAALSNQSIRRDVVMTGTISPDGAVGEVGGIIEKALAAREAGAKYMLVPKMMLHEALLLSTVSPRGGFAAIEVANLSEAERILFSPNSANFSSDFIPKSDPLPRSLPGQRYDADTGRFSLVATHVVDRLLSKGSPALSAARGTTANASQEYFSDEIAKYRRQIEAGYPFTAANAAFLLSVDAEYLKISDLGLDINGSIRDVEACLSSLPVPQKTAENFHWAVGADLRRLWAENKLNDTVASRPDREAYSTMRDLLYAYGWCGISRELAAQAQDIGGTPANESALGALAEEKLAGADSALSSSSFPSADAYSHLENGYDAYGRGMYGAAIYEAAYARSMQSAADEAGGKNFSSAADALANGTRSSLWGKIYFGQGLYLYHASREKLASPSDAYRILSYSSALDEASRGIDSALGSAPLPSQPAAGQQPPGASPAAANWQKAAESLALLACVLSLSALTVYRMGKDDFWKSLP